VGLALEVGILADLNKNDAEGFEYHAGAISRLNGFLASCGLPQHSEPTECEVWSGEMLGYSGLHDLRRLAAHFDCQRTLPPPSNGESSEDSTLAAYFAAVEKKRPTLVSRLFRSGPTFRREFDHLIVHSDAEGYYLPHEFEGVLFPPSALQIPGGMVGSVPRLLRELDRLAELLEIPAHLSDGADELWEAADAPSANGDTWKRYGRESFGCVMLREACRRAMSTGAILVFC
jgi:hypothetical protein